MSAPDMPLTVTYASPRWLPEWAVPEIPVPEAASHDLGIEYLRSLLRAWAERTVPWLAIEIVSEGHPYKDYLDTPERCAACGIGELWVYDPLLVGPKRAGGPYALQIWSRERDTMRRIHASNEAGHSPALDAWLHPSLHPDARGSSRSSADSAPNKLNTGVKAQLRIASARVGGSFWPTLETQRLEREREVSAREREVSAREIDRLRAEIEALRGR